MIPDLAVWIIAISVAIVAIPTLVTLLLYALAGVALGVLSFINKVTK